MGAEPAKNKARKALVRGLALLLVVAMLATILLYRRTNVLLDAGEMENKSARVAAMQLLRDDAYVAAPRLSRMTAYARSLVAGEHSFEDYELAAQIAVAQNQLADAAAFTEKSIELCPNDQDILAALYLRMGYLTTLQEKYQDALVWFDRGLCIISSPEALLTRAQVKLNLGDTEGALDDVTGYLQTAENVTEMLPDLINVYEAAGQFETAAALYTRLIDATGDERYLLNRAYCYTNLNRMEEAEADCGRYAASGGEQAGAADVMLGIGWMRNGEYDKADESFVRAAEEGYSDPEALYYYVVLCAYVNQNFARACEYGDLLINRVLGGGEALAAGLHLENTTGKLKVTLAEMDLASLCLMTGASHVRMGDYDQAVDSLTACLEQDGNAAFANYLRGSCLLAAEKFAEAEKDFDIAIEAGEREEESRFGRGVCRMQLGDRDGAMNDFDWVLLNGKDEALFEEASRLMDELMRTASAETADAKG